jgi:hypothetical protein
MNPWSRRAFLRAAGTCLALPLLPSLAPLPARAAEGDPPVRLLFWYVSNGIHMASWRPTTTGEGFTLPPILTPLASVRDQVSVLSGLANLAGRYHLPGDHARGTAAFLTCARGEFTSDASSVLGISADQVAAQTVVGQTPFTSLQLGMEGGVSTGSCDSGYPCAYQRNISWADANTPLPKMADPRSAFQRLFGGLDGVSPEELERRKVLRLSVLDAVSVDAQRLQRKLAPSDAARLDQYLTGVRELETRIDGLDTGVCEVPAEPSRDLDLPGRAAAMNEIMALAFACDLTRITSYMFANGGSGRSHPWLGIADNHHELSHHQGRVDNHTKLEAINRWEVQMFADFLSRLDGLVEPDGSTVLDNSLIVFGSEISDGDRHNHDDMPILLAGGGRGVHRPGRHIVYPGQEPQANLYLAMLDAFGAPQSSFADSTRVLPGLG